MPGGEDHWGSPYGGTEDVKKRRITTGGKSLEKSWWKGSVTKYRS